MNSEGLQKSGEANTLWAKHVSDSLYNRAPGLLCAIFTDITVT